MYASQEATARTTYGTTIGLNEKEVHQGCIL